MNINEIENTLQLLIKRHPNLDEEMLVTLLTSGGWDERAVSEAVNLYHHNKGVFSSAKNEGVLLPKTEEENLLPPEVPVEHLLLEHNQEIKETVHEEPQSLVSSSAGIIKNVKSFQEKDTEPPSDLPLRPFESSHHVWPFSRYKDVFYGEVMPTLTTDEQDLAKKHKFENIYIVKTPMTDKEKKLVVFASAMLLVILLLLGYMYSNGRL